MKIKHIVGLLILVAIIFFGTVFMFVYTTFAPGPNDLKNQTQSTQNKNSGNNSSTQTPTSTTSNQTTQGQLPESDTHTALDDCITLKASQAKGKQYEKGSLIVVFVDAMDLQTGVETIHLAGAVADESADAQSNFAQNHWLQASVPPGSEFKFQCLLEASDGVKRASLNLMFNLHQ